jgi:riboflavin synthase
VFTGIVEGVGRVARVEACGGLTRIGVDLGPTLSDGLRIGDSIAVSGCCLTVVAIQGATADFEMIPETLERTWFGALRAGAAVNLERALRAGAGARLDGHIVQGHVDGVAQVVERDERAGEVRLTFEAERRLTDDMVEKGSVALDGVSLTLTLAEPGRFGVALIPHTLAVTTLGARAHRGDRLNVETDVIGKWVRRMVAPYLPQR